MRKILTALACFATFHATSTIAQVSGVQRVVLRPQPLKTALQEVGRRFSVELLFSEDVVGTRQAPALSGSFTAQEALAALLAGSGLVVRGSTSAGFIVTTVGNWEGDDVAAVPEILVLGHRTQNADIQRLAGDVQPYQILSRKDVQNSHASTIEQLIGKRMSQDAVGLTFSQMPVAEAGSTRSIIDLRGLGTDETLVLLDGRRLPRLPGRLLSFMQADVNGISPAAIERVEVITSTAGGIYGPGAIGGVVNLVLRREYRGAEASVTRGITSRGDAPYGRFDARIGFTPDRGATEVALSYSRSVSIGLKNGDRDYLERARALRFANSTAYHYTQMPISRSINITSTNGSNLVLKPEYGGTVLGSALTSLAPGDYGNSTALGSALASRAGALDLALSDGASGKGGSLVADRRTSMVLANIRHRFGDGIEAYADYVRLADRGHVTYSTIANYQELSATDPRNPFQQAVGMVIPTPDFGTNGGTRSLTTRFSGGLLVDLPLDWRANLDYARGIARQTLSFSGTTYSLDAYYAFYGVTAQGMPPLELFRNNKKFRAALVDSAVPSRTDSEQLNRSNDLSVRFAGPVFRLAGGPLTATALLEQRSENVGPSTSSSLLTFLGIPYEQSFPGYGERVRSAYVELRAPLMREDGGLLPLRGLELQLALRRDVTRVNLTPGYLLSKTSAADSFDTARRAAMTYTFGAKIMPVQGLLLRASIATGEQTPPLSAIGNARTVGTIGPDPKRGGGMIIAPYDLIIFDRGKITPERSRSVSAGMVITPSGANGLLVSLDYTRIQRTREVNELYIGSVYYFLRNESLYPDRVTRLPLTPEDAARGFTGGVITRVDASYLNRGWTEIDALDARMTFPVHTQRRGDFTVRGNVTWQPRYRRFVDASSAVEDLISQADGVLEWRGNAGVDWTKGPLEVSLSGQYYGSYRATYGAGPGAANPSIILYQGRERIDSQMTADFAAGYSFELPGRGGRVRLLEFRFSIQDLLDRRPQTVVAADGGYSYYADPRRRRFEMTVGLAI